MYVVEQNRDGQMLALMKMDLPPAQTAKLRSICYYGGLPIDGETVTTQLLKLERG